MMNLVQLGNSSFGLLPSRAQSAMLPKPLNIELQPLPAYSPDFMPVEHLWQWLREDLTDHICYDQPDDLIAQVELFQARINDDPLVLSQRLWVSTQLNPEVEKLRIST